MERKTELVLAALFIIASGIVYTLERFGRLYVWVGQMNSASHTGSYPAKPDMHVMTDNWFIVLFLAIGVFFFIKSFRE